eukprot:4201741-Alexandrium_andersonii.AAC.1
MCIRDRCRIHPSRASGTDVEAIPGLAQFQVRTAEAILAVSLSVDATRFDRFNSLLGSIGSIRYSVRS